MKKLDWLIISFIILTSIYTLKDLFKPGFYTSHDGPNQVVRLYYFDQLIKDGQIPPRYVGELFNGFGYPLFSFSYQFPWFIAEPFKILGFSILDSIKAAFLLGYIFSGLTIYLFLKEIFGRIPAVTGTFIYLFAPDRFLNIYVRAAAGDATSFIFPPLIFLAIYKVADQNNINWKWITIGAISMAGLILSHAMVFMFFYLAIISYVLFSSVFIKFKMKYLINIFLLNLFSYGIAAYYFIPSLIERNITIFSGVMGPALIGNGFASLKNLIYSPWGYGAVNSKEGGMSVQIGLAQIFVFLTSLILVVFVFIRKKSNSENSRIIYNAVFFLWLFLGTIFLILPDSKFIWDLLKNIAAVDFTWRMLPVVVFSASVLAAFTVRTFKKYRILVSLIIILLALYSNRNHLRINQSLDWPAEFYLNLVTTSNLADEYTPVWARRDLMKQKVKNKVEFTDNKADILVLENKSNYLKASVNALDRGLVKINTVYYPGWSVFVDGVKVKLNYESSGFMEIPLEKGIYKVEAKFTETPLRLFSDFLSVASIGFLAIMVKKQKKHD